MVTVMSLFSLLAAACAGPRILELDFVARFNAVANDSATVLTISGVSGHSSYAVKRIDTHKEGSDLIVEVRLVLAREGLSGKFTHDVKLDPDVQRVLFGEHREVIWTRQ
jgi:hypothetical protein